MYSDLKVKVSETGNENFQNLKVIGRPKSENFQGLKVRQNSGSGSLQKSK